jgi:hypothetical protein
VLETMPVYLGRGNHGIALIAMWLPGQDLAGPFAIRAQCECGGHETFNTPVTLELFNSRIGEMRHYV